jgi:hypothetical protein
MKVSKQAHTNMACKGNIISFASEEIKIPADKLLPDRNV